MKFYTSITLSALFLPGLLFAFDPPRAAGLRLGPDPGLSDGFRYSGSTTFQGDGVYGWEYSLAAAPGAKVFHRRQGGTAFPQGEVISLETPVHTNRLGLSVISITSVEYFPSLVECGYSALPGSSWNNLREGIAGVSVRREDGEHLGWIRFTRPDLEPTTAFVVADQAWHPLPSAAIQAGLPPSPPPMSVRMEDEGLAVSWDSRFPDLILEWAPSLAEPTEWKPVERVQAGEARLDAADVSRFLRLRHR